MPLPFSSHSEKSHNFPVYSLSGLLQVLQVFFAFMYVLSDFLFRYTCIQTHKFFCLIQSALRLLIVFFLILYITFFHSRYHSQTYSLLKFSFVSQSIFPILLNCLAIVCTVSYKVSFKKLLVSQAVFFLFFARVTSSFVSFISVQRPLGCSVLQQGEALLVTVGGPCSHAWPRSAAPRKHSWWLLFSHLKVPCTWLPHLQGTDSLGSRPLGFPSMPLAGGVPSPHPL